MSFAHNKATGLALFSTTDDHKTGDEWETPDDFFRSLDREFRFTLDACASPANAKVKECYITKEEDALKVPWKGRSDGDRVWCNPPYGRDISLWLRKGRMEAENGCLVVFLVHARTDTRWFHEHVYRIADEIRFVRGRLKFKHSGGTTGTAPFPSLVAVYRPKAAAAIPSSATAANTHYGDLR
jgi:site-specific DNA-methyltransferase (adenine-specific)